MREDMRRTEIGYALSGPIGLGIIGVGTQFLVSPAKAAAEYGISVGRKVSSADPYLSVKGVRDIASGLVGDAVIVLRRGGRKSTAYGVHAPTAAAMVATAAILLG